MTKLTFLSLFALQVEQERQYSDFNSINNQMISHVVYGMMEFLSLSFRAARTWHSLLTERHIGKRRIDFHMARSLLLSSFSHTYL